VKVLSTRYVPRILAYVRHHLSEADLEPARIAAAHHISTRYLYRLFEKEGISLEQL
jgi:AraC-like DNA-binding protein